MQPKSSSELLNTEPELKIKKQLSLNLVTNTKKSKIRKQTVPA
jgi:hypothetical protein